MYRRVSYPGDLVINNENLTFQSESISDTSMKEKFILSKIKDVKLKKGLLGNSLCILYQNDWYEFHKFQDDNYNEIFDVLKSNVK